MRPNGKRFAPYCSVAFVVRRRNVFLVDGSGTRKAENVTFLAKGYPDPPQALEQGMFLKSYRSSYYDLASTPKFKALRELGSEAAATGS